MALEISIRDVLGFRASGVGFWARKILVARKGLNPPLFMGFTKEDAEAMRQRTEAAIARGKGKARPTADPLVSAVTFVEAMKQKKRLRQDTKPLMNKLESEWFSILSLQFPNYPRPRAQAKRYKLANGSWYKPDVTASSWPVENGPAQETAWEVKGPKQMKSMARGMLTIKFAATQWPEVRFVLVWKENGTWQTQHVLT